MPAGGVVIYTSGGQQRCDTWHAIRVNWLMKPTIQCLLQQVMFSSCTISLQGHNYAAQHSTHHSMLPPLSIVLLQHRQLLWSCRSSMSRGWTFLLRRWRKLAGDMQSCVLRNQVSVCLGDCRTQSSLQRAFVVRWEAAYIPSATQQRHSHSWKQ